MFHINPLFQCSPLQPTNLRLSINTFNRPLAVLEESVLDSAWNSFGLYINRQLRMGRAVHISKFGTFTFTAP